MKAVTLDVVQINSRHFFAVYQYNSVPRYILLWVYNVARKISKEADYYTMEMLRVSPRNISTSMRSTVGHSCRLVETKKYVVRHAGETREVSLHPKGNLFCELFVPLVV